MKSDMPKQFITLGDLPILMHTVLAFRKYDAEMKIVLVLPKDHLSYWDQLCSEYDFREEMEVVPGGDTRSQSVQRGLELVDDDALVAIHDGVRPLVARSVIERCFDSAHKNGNAVPCVPLKDSIRVLDNDSNTAKDRAHFRLIQTPQIFLGSLIKSAYTRNPDSEFTDDASVVEANGTDIQLVEGDVRNIKITSREDLLYAEAVIGTIEDNLA